MKCEITGCTQEMQPFRPLTDRTDGVTVEVLNTHRAYMVCNACAKKLGLIR
jgi:hypothetical protein